MSKDLTGLAFEAGCELALSRVMSRLEDEGHFGEGFGAVLVMIDAKPERVELAAPVASTGVMRGSMLQTENVVYTTNINSPLLVYRTLEHVAHICTKPERLRSPVYSADQIQRELYHEIGTDDFLVPTPEVFRRMVGYINEWKPEGVHYVLTAGLYYRVMFAGTIDRPSVERVLKMLCKRMREDGADQLSVCAPELDRALN